MFNTVDNKIINIENKKGKITMSDNNFRISGIPNNDDIDIPETPSKKSKTSGFHMISSEDLKHMSQKDINEIQKMLPPEMQNFISMTGIDFTQMFNEVGNMLSNMSDKQIENMCEMMGEATNIEGCLHCTNHSDDEEDDPRNLFPTGNSEYLAADEFGSIECYSSENLYEEFVARYGSDSNLYLDDNIGIRDFLLNEITSTINIDEIKNMRFINTTENYILFYMEPKDESNYGFYAAVIKKGEENFAIYIPTYCNTFDVITDDDDVNYHQVVLYNRDETPFMFDGAANDITSFKFLAANLIEFAISYALAPRKHVLLSPKSFGTIKNIRASASADSSMIPIGRITSNGSTNSTLLLKDAELPLDRDSYNIFMKFPSVMDEHFLRFLSQPLFEVDFNNCPLLENVELKYTTDGNLYFEVDHLKGF